MSEYGRFNTPDPYQASGGPGDPSSWNRYSYVQGDPINNLDPGGMDLCSADSYWDGTYSESACFCSGVYSPDASPYNSECGGGSGPGYWSPAAVGAAIQNVEASARRTLTWSVSLYERPVYVDKTIPGIGTMPVFVGERTYIDATAQLSTGAYVNFLCQGGPTGPNGTGDLAGRCVSGYNAMVAVKTSGPGLPANFQVGGIYSCANCGVVTQLLASVDLYSQSGNLAAYSGTMNGGYNSNSYAFTLLEDIGLAGFTSSGSAWSWFGKPWLAPGWGVTVPGLGP